MIRPDFAELFDFISRYSKTYSINTNGTLVTPKIARLMRRKGLKMIALYGATEKVHDHITRNPGSFQAMMQGISYLREAGAGFMIQIIPMRSNYHQLTEMKNMALSLSPRIRIGATWLYYSASHNIKRNRVIANERLPASVVVSELIKPSPKSPRKQEKSHRCLIGSLDDDLFGSCICGNKNLYVDPYGNLTFCQYDTTSHWRYRLREGNLREFWEVYLPSLKGKIRGGAEYTENCGSCELREDCFWCPIFGFLEHQRYSAKVEYLCKLAKESRNYMKTWETKHRRFYKIADLSIQVESDLPINDDTFHEIVNKFEVDSPGEDLITLRLHFTLPDDTNYLGGTLLYRRIPWLISRKNDVYVYYGGLSSLEEPLSPRRIALFNNTHTCGDIYNVDEKQFKKGGLTNLTLFSTDRILIARLLASRNGCFLHSSGVVYEGYGYLFVGNSGSGKSTILRLIENKTQVLSDEQVIIRSYPEGFRIYATWANPLFPEIAPISAPLRAILFLERSTTNRIIPILNRNEIVRRILPCISTPLVDKEWGAQTISLLEEISKRVKSYIIQFSGDEVVDELIRAL